ncbi:hypothetical protein ELG97_37070 [Rhizobium leguminosarum]|uniref:hypothetical protein n=1 Tax=Rhizobium leguminosarum TaxID=384 RepID=UPI001030C3BB|nr:hypothetical protein [Rhizobium leguminosarum]TBE73843.1 hypothetical protein ELG97_37070 [Rhizobium leguminosarum]
MTKFLTIIFHAKPDEIAFDISCQGKRFQDWRNTDTAQALKVCADVRKTAERFGGFRYINGRKAFVTAFKIEGNEAQKLITAFERQGFQVAAVGAVTAEQSFAMAA